MNLVFNEIDIKNENLKLRFHTKFLTFIFSIGLFIVFLVAYLALKGLKSDFDNSFPKPLNEVNLLNEFQSRYMLETINILQNPNNISTINQHIQSIYLWQIYHNMLETQTTQGNKAFIFLHELYQEIFLTHQFNEVKKLRNLKTDLIEELDNLITIELRQVLPNQNILLKYAQEINEISTKIVNTQVAIYMIEKKTADNFYTATLGMLWSVTALVFGIVISLSLIVLTFVQKLNSYLKKLVNHATLELRNLNEHLQEEVRKQVQVIREKDNLMYAQSKLASMGEMVQNIAHQWRQPLNSIILIIQGIKSKFDQQTLTRETIREQTRLALNIAQNMSVTIDNFRNFFRLDTQYTNFNIADAIQQAIVLNKPIFDSLNIKVHFKNDKTLVIFGSQQVLVQILLVLFNNSKDAFIERKIENPQCFISFEKESEYVVVRYYDNAGGISQHLLDKIFEPYFTTKHKSVGTGIGLYMAQELVSKYLQGNIFVSNHEFQIQDKCFKGALFVLKLSC